MAKAKSTPTKTNSAASAVIGLSAIVAAGANGMYTSPDVHASLVEQGLVEVNPGMTNEAGELATRATQKGIEQANAEGADGDENQLNSTATLAGANTSGNMQGAITSAYQIEDDVPMPTASGRGRGGNTYPFDALNVGQSFFVANSESKPNAAKSLASTVSSATARYAEPVEGQFKKNSKGEDVQVTKETRKFMVRAVDGGARVWRTA